MFSTCSSLSSMAFCAVAVVAKSAARIKAASDIAILLILICSRFIVRFLFSLTANRYVKRLERSMQVGKTLLTGNEFAPVIFIQFNRWAFIRLMGDRHNAIT